MSQSTDAILVFGIEISDEDEKEWDDGEEAKEGDEKKDGAALLRWMRNGQKTADGVSLVQHCSNSEAMFILAIDETSKIAWRGYPVAVGAMKTDPLWEGKLRAFADKHGLVLKGEAAWLLCSFWEN